LEQKMRVSKWGNSLAIRLPEAVVAELDLKSGDEIEVIVSGPRQFRVERDLSREPLPKGFRFDRDEAHAR
jgi:antitoxin MazE